ncbi:hypothetical protein GCM10028775_78830 [Catellatospora paridis]
MVPLARHTEHVARIPSRPGSCSSVPSPGISWLGDKVAIDDHGFVLTGSDVAGDDIVGIGSGAPRRP